MVFENMIFKCTYLKIPKIRINALLTNKGGRSCLVFYPIYNTAVGIYKAQLLSRDEAH